MRNDHSLSAKALLLRRFRYFASGVLGALAGAVLLSALGFVLLVFVLSPFIAGSWAVALIAVYTLIGLAVLGALLGGWWWARQARSNRSFEHLRLLSAGLGPVVLTAACMIGSLPAPSTAQVLLAIPVGFGIGDRLANHSSKFRTWLLVGVLSFGVLVVVPALPNGGRLVALTLLAIVAVFTLLRSPRD